MKTYYRVCTVSFLMTLFLFSGSVLALESPQLLVDVPWLANHLADDNVVIVDARSAKDYQNGHIPGAVSIPVLNTFNPKFNTDRVANSKHITKLFSEAGIRQDDTVLIYDSGKHIDAGRVFWVFEVFGHKKVKLLNGGYSGWTHRPDNKVSFEPPQVTKSEYIPKLEPQRLTTKFNIQLAIDNKDQVIIDARSSAEYMGKKSIASRSGRIPSSISIPWSKNFTEKNGVKVLKPISELKEIYASVDKSKKVFLYCNKGKQSSLSYMVMRELGFDAAHYDGSWYEWGNSEILPIE